MFDTRLAVRPGMWNCGTDNQESFIYAGHDINRCDPVPAARERAFAGQCFLVSASNILRMSDVPDDFPFKSSTTYGGPVRRTSPGGS